MSFPIDDYDKAVAALRAVVADRDAKGRNETNDFYQQFPHGPQDLTFELHRRVQRILGAEKLGNSQVVYEDTLDLANYAIFLMMLLSRPALNKENADQEEREVRKAVQICRANRSTAQPHLVPKADNTGN